MKLKLITAVAALLASVSASAGSLDGKAIICDWDRESESDGFARRFGFAFNEAEVIQHSVSFRRLNPEVTIRVFEPVAHTEYLNDVVWTDNSRHTSWVLDRRSLLLTVMIPDGDKLEFACEALPSWEALNEIMESVRAEEQSKNDEEMKDNKI